MSEGQTAAAPGAPATGVLEHLEVSVSAGREDAFSSMMHATGRPLLIAAAGCLGVEVLRGVEHEDKFLLLISWETLQAHLDFRETGAFRTFLKALGPFIAGRPAMEHFRAT